MSDVSPAILDREPSWAELPGQTPPRVRELLERCLQKDHKHRLRDIGDARLELKEALSAAGVTPVTAPAARRSSKALVTLGVVGLMLAAAGIWAGIERSANLGFRTATPLLSDGNRASPNSEANAYYERALLFGGAGTANPVQARRMVERALVLDPKFAAARAEFAFSTSSGSEWPLERFELVLYGRKRSTGRRCATIALRARAFRPGADLPMQGRKDLVRAELD